MGQKLIYLDAAIAVADRADYTGLAVEDVKKVTDEVVKGLKQLPSAQPSFSQPYEKNAYYDGYDNGYNAGFKAGQRDVLMKDLPSAQPEQPTRVQDILQYLDEYLHPIVSSEHWSIYSELYDMVSMLLPAQPEWKRGRWIVYYECPKCGEITKDFTEYCPFCNADMRGDKDG